MSLGVFGNLLLLTFLWAITVCSQKTASDSVIICNNNFDKSNELGTLLTKVTQQTQEIQELRTALNRVSQQCDGNTHTVSDNGILVQQNFNGRPFFHRSWTEFKAGFGNTGGDYWIGNDRLHKLTQDGRYKIRFDLLAAANKLWYWAEYSTFIVDDESTNYTLHIGNYTGTAGDAASGYGVTGIHVKDAMLNGAQFTTWDRDNDRDTNNNCANWANILGGFWYNSCGYILITNADASAAGQTWTSQSLGQWHDLLANRMTLLLL